MKEDDTVIICGSKEKEWIQQFRKYVGTLVNDAANYQYMSFGYSLESECNPNNIQFG